MKSVLFSTKYPNNMSVRVKITMDASSFHRRSRQAHKMDESSIHGGITGMREREGTMDRGSIHDGVTRSKERNGTMDGGIIHGGVTGTGERKGMMDEADIHRRHASSYWEWMAAATSIARSRGQKVWRTRALMGVMDAWIPLWMYANAFYGFCHVY